MNVSVVDRQDLEATARQDTGWMTIYVRNVVEMPVSITPGEPLVIVILPDKPQPMGDAEKRGWLIAEGKRKSRLPYTDA